jgi:hypothetical protein
VVGNRHAFFAAVRARDFAVNNSVYGFRNNPVNKEYIFENKLISVLFL